MRISLLLATLATSATAQIPIIPSTPVAETQVPVFTESTATRETPPLANFRLHLEYRLPKPQSKAMLRLHAQRTLDLTSPTPDAWQTLDLQYEQLLGQSASYSATRNGQRLAEAEVIGSTAVALADPTKLKFDQDFTAMVKFTTTGNGALLAKCLPAQWAPNDKMLGLREGKLFYDIGWLGVVNGKTGNLTDGQPHVAVVISRQGRLLLWLDGKRDAEKEDFIRPDVAEHTVQLGQGAGKFDGDLQNGAVENFRYWERSLTGEEAKELSSGKAGAVNTPLVNWSPTPAVATFPKGIPGVPTQVQLTLNGGAEVRHAWAQPLGDTPHAQLISQWSEESLAEGGKIYQSLCITCHGSLTQEGSMPTSRNFQREPFKNGNDPYRQWQTLTQGYGLMMPLPMFTSKQRYAVLHYVQETFVAAHNKTELYTPDAAYLDALPLAMRTLAVQQPTEDPSKQYEKMDFGPVLNWTYGITPDNIAYKGQAVRLDAGPGGVSKGRAWIVYDHDTMRVATAVTGSFIDWKNVAFDGSHNTHCMLTGERLFTNPVGPGWANPADGSWTDPRFHGRDDKPYGPLPRAWANYRGQYLHGAQVVQSYTIGEAEILEAAEVVEYGPHPVFMRTLNIGKSVRDLKLRLAPISDAVQVQVSVEKLQPVSEAGFQVLAIPASATPISFRVALSKGTDAASLTALLKHSQLPLDLSTLTHGGPPRCPEVVTTQGVSGPDEGPFATDIITHPESALNPWQSWMRLTAFDFFADGERAAVATWMGDVWIVEGLTKQPLGELKWHRIATGLFQPLGVKIVQDTIYVTCRDQLARLRDLNLDGEIDFIDCFNNDQQVTEHFHEFAMGLQTDAAGNFYYAKSARHALPALVPQHGTLLRVSADGLRTDILATGFRAANGVCLNPDGTFFVTDQEGHWTPKNRINLVLGHGPSEFYGNMFGYHDVTDSRDSAMEQPLCWITNLMDRSPSELLWVPQDAKWGALNGSLLNLSYGYGKIYTVPHEIVHGQAQGGVCALPMPQFPTGVMRGRFHPRDGQFYGCGMFAWAGNQSQPGGFYRVRATGKPAWQPTGLHFEKGAVVVKFSDALAANAADVKRYSVKAWSLLRSANYGSQHVDEHSLAVETATLADDHTLRLSIPTLHPTMGIEIICQLPQANAPDAERVIHGTIHEL